MTTVQIPVDRAPAQAGGASPKVVARTGLYALMAANVAVVTYFFGQSGFGTNALILMGRVTGLYGTLVMAFQFILVARLPWFDRRLGMDRLTTWHRWTGFTLLWLLLSHAVFITLGHAQLADLPPVTELVDLATTVEGVLRAVVALFLIIVIGGVSARYARRRMAYETWHFIHFYAYVAVVLAFTHQIAAGSTFNTSEPATAYWWGLWTFALGSVVVGRFGLPLYRNLRHQLRVAAVVPEADNVVSIYITGRDLHRMPARAGQFFLWRFLTRDRWYKANPFSLSAAPDGRSLRLTAKAAGEGSASLRYLKVGTRVFAEGPYGAFTAMHRTKPNAVLVAGGVGVTPIRALLEELHGHAVVLYRVRDPRDAVLLNELRHLALVRGAVLHLLTGPSAAPTPRGPLLAPHSLAAMVPDIRDRDVFVCGPPAMTDAVMTSLRELKVPKQQVHAERFSMAG
ncbi:ferredoxin reductase family protein [Umezawaea tangerina]|uniref:Putative ferric reductase n=1 Tax=Umezawaea tangerina TaxID=84725 RepID=A0A2T0TKS2_9PSEU|nr:ferredoxin reductase family protein [Umezawaea tangerina]PRY46314.1 putative ferric reductase [Umezawaea tangerina]